MNTKGRSSFAEATEDRGKYQYSAEEWRTVKSQGLMLAKIMYRGNEDLTVAVALSRGLAVAMGIWMMRGPQEWNEEDFDRARKMRWEREGDLLRAAQAAGAWWLAGRRAEWVDGVLERSEGSSFAEATEDRSSSATATEDRGQQLTARR